MHLEKTRFDTVIVFQQLHWLREGGDKGRPELSFSGPEKEVAWLKSFPRFLLDMLLILKGNLGQRRPLLASLSQL